MCATRTIEEMLTNNPQLSIRQGAARAGISKSTQAKKYGPIPAGKHWKST
jgi:hypothetical protein